MRLEKETFGPVLRAARERRGVTLKQLALETKLSVDLWEALEDNDLSRWPKRVFARSYVRDYAIRVGLDPDEVVNEFCRLFPEWGDRRAERVIREKAQIIAHDLAWEDLPAPQPRRASDRTGNAQGFMARYVVRLAGALIDLAAVLASTLGGISLGVPPWPALAMSSIGFSVFATSLAGRSLGLMAAEWLIRTIKSFPAARRLISSRA